ncbi:MAG TPA: hypothetical protein VL966_03075 [Alphaproteobacteria bacterium]|nr:hypothetical protein [Alphaproteobacteria bacterium]
MVRSATVSRNLVRIALASGALLGAAAWAGQASAHERGVVVVGQPVYVAPAPVYYQPPPRVVYVPAPAYYAPQPVYEPGLSFIFRFGDNDRREHYAPVHDNGRHRGWDRR